MIWASGPRKAWSSRSPNAALSTPAGAASAGLSARPRRRRRGSGEAAGAVDQRYAREREAAVAAAPQLGGLAVERLVLGQSGEDRQGAVRILLEAEQAGELLAQKRGRRAADRGRGTGRQSGEAERVVRLPGPVGCGAQEIGLALARRNRRGRARRPAGPARNGERDLLPLGRGAHPQIDVAVAVGGNGGARDGDAEPLGEPGERGDLRHGEHAAFAPAGLLVQGGECRIGGDQAAVGVEPAGDGVELGGAAHADSADGRARVETRATAAR